MNHIQRTINESYRKGYSDGCKMSVEEAAANLCPRIYASYTLGLWKCLSNKYTDEEKQNIIANVVNESEKILCETVDNEEKIIKRCTELTGIDFRRRL